MKKIRVFEAFAGYGSQSLALERLKKDFPTFVYEVVGISEIDKYAIQAYNALHPSVTNYGDISKIDWSQVPDFDLFTYSFPCTDISNAGAQQGFTEGSNTRSSLLWECRKAIIEKKPKYLLLENVASLVESKFIKLFNKWQAELESYGYSNFTQVLNAKDYGVPQNRKRVFMLSILGRGNYYFPKPFKLEKRLKDVLETNVDDKYYLNDKQISMFTALTEKVEVKQVGNIYPDTDKFKNRTMGRVYSADGISPTLNCCGGGDREPKILDVAYANREARGYAEAQQGVVVPVCLNSKVNGKQPSLSDRVYDENGISTAVTCSFMPSIQQDYRIRKLTPRECFRLMGLRDKEIDTIQSAGISNSQQYKLAGNSIVVSCLYHLFRKLFVETENENQQLTLF